MNLLIFKIVQCAVLGVFIVFISDFRRKKDMVPLIGEQWTLLLKASYLVPLSAYIHALVTAEWIGALDYVALGITLAGTSLVVKAKRDLAEHHTCVGYCMASKEFITRGIYAYMRHPLYTGIYMVVAGSLFTVLPHLNLSLHFALPAAALCTVLYAAGFLGFLARRETAALLEKYGAPFQRYKENVHPFLPLRKYAASPRR